MLPDGRDQSHKRIACVASIFVAKADQMPRQQGFRGRGIWFFADSAFVDSLFVDLNEFSPFVTRFTMPSFREERKGKEKKL